MCVRACACVRQRECVRVCVRACIRACMRACVRACVRECNTHTHSEFGQISTISIQLVSCFCVRERERSNYKDLKKKHKSFYSPKMGGTEKGAVGARGLLVWHSSSLTGLPHVTSSELPFFRVEKSESSVSAKGGEKRKKMFRQETK